MWISPLAPASMQLLRQAHTTSRRTARQSLRWFHHQNVLTRIAIVLLACVACTPLASALTSPASSDVEEATFYIRPLPNHIEVKRAYPMAKLGESDDETPVEKRLRVIPHKHGKAASLYLDHHELIRLRETPSLAKPYDMALSVARTLYEATTRQPLTVDAFKVQTMENGAAQILVFDEPLMTVDQDQALAAGEKMSIDGLSTKNLAATWVRHLTEHFGLITAVAPTQGGTTTATVTSGGFQQSGQASWYGPNFNGRRTASGERFDMNLLTAAHRTLPFGTLVQVTNTRNNKSAIVKINDRGPFSHSRIIDLSKGAAQAIGMLGSGVARVTIQVVQGGGGHLHSAIAAQAQPATSAPTRVAYAALSQPVVPIRPAVTALTETPPEPMADPIALPSAKPEHKATAPVVTAIATAPVATPAAPVLAQPSTIAHPIRVACAEPATCQRLTPAASKPAAATSQAAKHSLSSPHPRPLGSNPSQR